MMHREELIRCLLGKTVHITVDRPIGYDHNGIIYPVNYGFIPGVIAGDGEEQDAYILGVDIPLTEFEGRVIGAVRRKNDFENKLVVAPEGVILHQAQIAAAVWFQERFFDTTVDSILRKSCGVMVFRRQEDGMKILLCSELHSKRWSLPKGHMEAFETEEQTALRELWEETGMIAQLLPIPPATEEYSLPHGVRKQVTYFAAEAAGAPRPQEGEIGELLWSSPDELPRYLLPGTVKACNKLMKYL